MKTKRIFVVFLLCLCAMLSFPFWGGSGNYNAVAQSPCSYSYGYVCGMCSSQYTYWQSPDCLYDECYQDLVFWGPPNCLQYTYCTGCWGIGLYGCQDMCTIEALNTPKNQDQATNKIPIDRTLGGTGGAKMCMHKGDRHE